MQTVVAPPQVVAFDFYGFRDSWPPTKDEPRSLMFGFGGNARYGLGRVQLSAEQVGVLKASLLGGTAPQVTVQMCRFGHWEGHWQGEVTFDLPKLEAIKRNFDAIPNPVRVTYGHPSYEAETSGYPCPTAAWIRSLEVRGDGSDVTRTSDGLWGVVEFTQPAAQMIERGEIRFCSVVVDFAAVDRVTGEPCGPVLRALGLTDDPFITAMQPITFSATGPTGSASSTRSFQMDPKKVLAVIAKALGLGTDVAPGTLSKVFNAFMALYTAGTEGDGEVPTPEAMAASWEKRSASILAFAAKPAVQKAVRALAGADGAPADPADEAAEAKILDLLAKATGLDLAGLAAAIEQNLDAVKGAILGGAASGMPADTAAAMSALEKKLSAGFEAKVAALTASNTALQTEVARLTKAAADEVAAEAEAAKVAIDGAVKAAVDGKKLTTEEEPAFRALAATSLDDARAAVELVHEAVEKGHILAAEAKPMRTFAFASLAGAKEMLAERAKHPAVPTTRLSSTNPRAKAPAVKTTPSGEVITMPVGETEDEKRLIRSLSQNTVIRDPKAKVAHIEKMLAKHREYTARLG
jgi:Mu-like prophage I protein